MGAEGLQFRVLGPLEVWREGKLVAVRAPKHRILLATLLFHANRVVPAAQLVDCLWGQTPPATAHATLQTYVSQLRRLLQPEPSSGQVLVTKAPGYLLLVQPEQVDLARFQRLVVVAREAMANGDPCAAAERLRQALALWHGPALGGVPSPHLSGEAARLEEARLGALEDRVEAELALGWHARLVGELEALVAEQPLRERLRGQLMVALYRSGRQAEALAVYRQARQALVDELGLEPGRELQRLQQAILTADPTLDPDTATGQSTVAPGRTAPAQLPADVADFTGRRQHLQQLDRLLPTEGTTTTAVVISAIAGTAGVGKTALAVHWGHHVSDRFPDGQLYVNLRGYAQGPPLRPIGALAQLLHGLGVAAEQVPGEVEQAAALYRSLLAGKRLLVVLDNARSADQVRLLLPGNPGCLVVVTSRDRLAGLVAREGARRLTLDVLDPDEADTLLGRILGDDRLRAEPDAAAELARICAYLPLALRIAAANLTDQPGHSIASFVAELAEGNRLAALQVDSDQQTAVRAAFDLSYTALDQDAQQLFRLLGLIPGPDVTADAAAALAGTTPRQARSRLGTLASAHLLDQHRPGRFAFHDLLRLYAAERVHDLESPAARTAARRRLLDWYLHTVDTAAGLLYSGMLRLPSPPSTAKPPQPVTTFPDHTQALAWLDAERLNLVAAVQHAAEHGPRPAAWLLADALRGYFWAHMFTVDWLTVADSGLAAARADGDLRAEAAAQLSLADAHLCQGEYHQAIEHYTTSLTLNRQSGWLDGQAAALGNLGNVCWELGRLREAADHLSEALAIAQRSGRVAGQAAALGNLGLVYRELGRLQEAADHHTRALALNQQLGSRDNQGIDLSNLGEDCHALGQLDQALDHLTHAQALHEQIGDRDTEAETLRILAEVHRDAGRHTDALQLGHAALTLARDNGARRYEADALNALGTIYERLGQHRRAVEHHQQALRLAREIQARFPELTALIGLAAFQRLGRSDEALACAHQALTLARQSGCRVLEGHALTTLADVYLNLDHPERAADYAEQALAIHRETGHRLGQARTLRILGYALYHTGGIGAARSPWREALALFTSVGTPEADNVRTLLRHPPTPRSRPARA
jgi:DNA-binding SARP family transcriptional activator